MEAKDLEQKIWDCEESLQTAISKNEIIAYLLSRRDSIESTDIYNGISEILWEVDSKLREIRNILFGDEKMVKF